MACDTSNIREFAKFSSGVTPVSRVSGSPRSLVRVLWLPGGFISYRECVPIVCRTCFSFLLPLLRLLALIARVRAILYAWLAPRFGQVRARDSGDKLLCNLAAVSLTFFFSFSSVLSPPLSLAHPRSKQESENKSCEFGWLLRQAHIFCRFFSNPCFRASYRTVPLARYGHPFPTPDHRLKPEQLSL